MTSAFDTDEFKTPTDSVAWGEEPPKADNVFNVKDFVSNYKRQANKATGAGGRLADAFVDVSRRILSQFWSFAKQAIEIALSKFLVELCAMIIAGISAALASRHKMSVDISTPGVFYNKNGQTVSTPPNSSQGSLWDKRDSPFDSGWSRSSSPAW